MALADETYLSLKNVRLGWTLAAGSAIIVADATEIQIPLDPNFFDRTPGGSWVKREVPGEIACVMTVAGWASGILGLAQLAPYTRLTAFTLLSTQAGTPSILPSWFFSVFPIAGMMLGKTSTTLTNEPSKWTTEIRTNVDGTWGGFPTS